MNETDREKFSEAVTGLLLNDGRDVTKPLLNVWWAALHDHDLKDIQKAILEYVKDPECGRYPVKTQDIIRRITGTGDERARAQWVDVMQQIASTGSYGSPEFTETTTVDTIESFGGWRYLCSMSAYELERLERTFIERYKSIERGETQIKLCKPQRVMGDVHQLAEQKSIGSDQG